MIPFAIIVAMDLDSGIGKNGGIPWHLPADMKHFKKITTETRSSFFKNAVIMGRRTWDSLPEKFRPLPGRINVVITRNDELHFSEGVLKVDSLNNALMLLGQDHYSERVEEIFVIGGAQIFKEAVEHPSCHKIYLTKILARYDCDAFFPPLNPRFTLAGESQHHREFSAEYYFSEYILE